MIILTDERFLRLMNLPNVSRFLRYIRQEKTDNIFDRPSRTLKLHSRLHLVKIAFWMFLNSILHNYKDLITKCLSYNTGTQLDTFISVNNNMPIYV